MFTKQADKQRQLSAEEWADKARRLHQLAPTNGRDQRVAYAQLAATMAVYEQMRELTEALKGRAPMAPCDD